MNYAPIELGKTELRYVELNHRERCELLEQTAWANDFSWSQIKLLAQYMYCFAIDPKKVVFYEGANEPYMCIIAEGDLMVAKATSDGQWRSLTHLASGQAFGEMAIIDNEPRSAAVVAIKKSQLLIFTKEDFFKLVHDYPAVGVRILLKLTKMLSQRLRKTSGQLVDTLHPKEPETHDKTGDAS